VAQRSSTAAVDGRDATARPCTPSGSSTGVWFNAWLAEHRDEIEAERRRKHAEFMARSRANMKRYREQIARNRRALERRKQPT